MRGLQKLLDFCVDDPRGLFAILVWSSDRSLEELVEISDNHPVRTSWVIYDRLEGRIAAIKASPAAPPCLAPMLHHQEAK